MSSKKRVVRAKKEKNINKVTANSYINEGGYIKSDTVGILLIVAIAIFILSPIITISTINVNVRTEISGLNESITTTTSNVLSQLSGLENSITSLSNNKGFSESISRVSNSVYLIIKRPMDSEDTMNMGSIYVDSDGGKWKKGTGFAVSEDGWIITAKHVVDNATEVFVVDYGNGKEELYPLHFKGVHTNIDLAILKINKTTTPIKIYDAGDKPPYKK